MIGFGENYPKNAHHKGASCPDRYPKVQVLQERTCPDYPEPCSWKEYENKGPNHQTLHGSLVGGPDKFDYHNDTREGKPAHEMNEGTLDYNAGFQSAVAYLTMKYC